MYIVSPNLLVHTTIFEYCYSHFKGEETDTERLSDLLRVRVMQLGSFRTRVQVLHFKAWLAHEPWVLIFTQSLPAREFFSAPCSLQVFSFFFCTMQGWTIFSKCVRHSPSVPSGAKVEAGGGGVGGGGRRS